MSALGFVGSWGCGMEQRSPLGERRRSTSTRMPLGRFQNAPRMALLSSKELEVLFESGDFKSAKYALDILVPGEATKESRRQSIRRIKANANFDGFRKGTIPPFIMSQVNEFVLRDCIEDEINAACKELGLTFLEGDASDPDFDFKEAYKRFEVGKDIEISFEIGLQTAREKDDETPKQDPIEAAVSQLPDVKG